MQPVHHQKLDEDAPNRCHSTASGDQCRSPRVEGSTYCLRHGGHVQISTDRKNALRNYRLTLWQNRVNEFADNENAKSLREEIGITRMQLESLLNRCESDVDLLTHGVQIGKLVDQVQMLVNSCQKLEEKAGIMLDKTQLLVICEGIVKIVGGHVADPNLLVVLGDEITTLIVKSVPTSMI